MSDNFFWLAVVFIIFGLPEILGLIAKFGGCHG
jgi:hypothetical protein